MAKWPNQNSKTTFIVRIFPKNGPYGFDLVNLSLLGVTLAIFQFCGFSGLFWPFFPCKWGPTENGRFAKEDGLKSKNARKQTHIKIQFYNRKKVTSLKIFILTFSLSPTIYLCCFYSEI